MYTLNQWATDSHLQFVTHHSVFPVLQKTAKVKPLHKKGDKYDMNNYRPISIIPVFVKILERLLNNRIISFLYDNKILSDAQNGFRKGK